MVAEIQSALADFTEANRTRCFLNIVNLIAKSLLKQLEVKKKGPDGTDTTNKSTKLTNNSTSEPHTTEEYAETDPELLDLSKDQEVEEELAMDYGEDDEEDDDLEGWVDEVSEMTVEEREALETKVRPIKIMLGKVSLYSYHVNHLLIHST